MTAFPRSARPVSVLIAALVAGCLVTGSPRGAEASTIRQSSAAANEVAIGGGYVVWTSHDPESPNTHVRERRLTGTNVRTVVFTPIALDGLASTRRWLVYTPQLGQSIALVAYVRRTGARRVLSTDVIGRIAQDGERIAWAERSHGRQRIIVLSTRTRRKWIAADLPTCAGGRCYRLDAVTLAPWGVWFVRGALGSFPSQIVRRRFGGHSIQTLPVTGDPQPDAVAGNGDPIFFWLHHGYVQWPNGRRFTKRVAGLRPHETLLRRSRQSLDLLRQSGGTGVIVRIVAGRERLIDHGPRAPQGGIAPLASIAWTGQMFVTAWNVYPRDGDGPGDDPSYSEVHLVNATRRVGSLRTTPRRLPSAWR